MNIFLIFFYNLIFCIIIGLSYFLLKEYDRVSPTWIRKNRIVEISFILVLGTLLFVYEYFIAVYSKSPILLISISPIIIFTFLIYYKKNIVIYTLPFLLIGLFFNLYQNDYEITNIFLIIFILGILLFLVQLFIRSRRSNYFEKKWKKLLSAVYIYLILILIVILIYDLAIQKNINNFYFYIIFINFLFFSVYSTIFITIFEGINNLYINFFNLKNSLIWETHSFYKLLLWKKELQNKLAAEKINFGALILIDIKNQEKYSKEELENFFLSFQQKINENYQNTFFFRATSNYYSIFIPFIFKEVNLKLIYENNYSLKRKGDFFENLYKILNDFKINLKAYISLYGIDSYDIDQLIKNAQYLLFAEYKENVNNKLIVYNFREIKDSFIEKFESAVYVKKYNQYQIDYILALTTKRIYYCIQKLNFQGKIVSFQSIKSNLPIVEQEFLLRYFALKTIKNFTKNTFDYLIFEYPVSYLLSSEFDSYKFIKKINSNFKYGIEKVLIGIKSAEITEENLINLKKILLNLKRQKLNYAILDYEINGEMISQKIKPKYKKNSEVINNFNKFLKL